MNFIQSIPRAIIAICIVINNNLNKASEITAKVPAFDKTATKSVLDWGPVLFILAHFSHDVSHKREKAIAFQDNYNQIKGEQAVIRAALDVHDELAASVDAE